MYRVYLADDNDLFRESLIKTISWEKIDCTLIGETAIRPGGRFWN